MKQRFGVYIISLLIGAVFGMGLGAANGNPAIGTIGGALAGVFLGWFIAAAVLEKEKKKGNKTTVWEK
jgi:ABC-type uncharacterized transport system permease subunit